MIIRGYAISDIHFGAVPGKRLYSELNAKFLVPLYKSNDIKVVVINGDLTDKKITVNDEHGRYLVKFMNDLVNICGSKKIKIRILRGTRNHDLNQLNIFSYLEGKKNLDFRIINTVCEEEIYPDFKVLYIPEEYMNDQESYYKTWFDNEYAMVFGHGTMEFQAFENQVIESEKPIMNAPVFKYNDFDNVQGAVIFGHIHNRCSYKNKLYYCGSFTRWMFGEEIDKGYISWSYNTDNSDTNVEYINNDMAKTYITVDLSDKINTDQPLDKQIEDMEDLKKQINADHIRFTIVNDGQLSEVDTILLKSYFKQNDSENTKINVKKNNVKKTKEESELLEKYDFIFNSKLSLADTISKYLKIHDDIEISSEDIEKELFEEQE